MALSKRHQRFVEEYSVDQNGTQAYIRAGYQVSADSARRASSLLLKNPEIQAELAKIQADLSVKTGINAEWVLNNLKSVAERCMQSEAVTDKDGNPTGEYKFDSAGANKALDTIGKSIGMFKEKSEVELKITKKMEDFFS